MVSDNGIDRFAVQDATHRVCDDQRSGHRLRQDRLYLGASVLALLIAFGADAQAQETAEPEQRGGWQYSANTNVGLTMTDNVLLTQLDPETDFITTLTAGVQVSSATRGGTINFAYDFNYDFYVETDELNGLRHNLLTDNTFVVSEDFLFVDVNGSIREQAFNRNLRTPVTTRTINSNQTMVLAGSISPYIDTSIGDRVGVVARAGYSVVDFVRPDVTGATRSGDGDARWSGNLALRSLETDRALTWEAYGQASKDDDNFEQQGAGAVLRLAVGQNMRLLTRGGYDNSSGRRSGLDIDNGYWRAGFEYQPLEDAFIRVEAGERYGGPSYDALIRYNVTDALNINASYVQQLQTDQDRIVGMVNDYIAAANAPFVGIRARELEPPSAAGIVIDDELVSTSTIGDTAQVTLSGAIGQVAYSLSGYIRTREYDVVLLSGELLEDRSTGGSFSLSRGFGRRTSVGLNAQYVDEESNYTDADFGFLVAEDGDAVANLVNDIDSITASVFASYMLSPTSQVTLNYSHAEREDQDGLKVEENAVMLTIAKSW